MVNCPLLHNSLGEAPDPNRPESISYLLSLLEGVGPSVEDVLINAKIRNILQLALKKPYQLTELGLLLETARAIHNGAIEYVNQSQYGVNFLKE